MASSDAVPELVVVCDAGPPIHLDEMGCLDLLNDFSRVLVPDAVWSEVKCHRPGALLHSEDTFERILSTGIEPPTLRALARSLSLHGGERAALAVALENQANMQFTDDAAARLAAGSLGIPCHGSLGVLVRAIRRRQRTKKEVVSLLRELPIRSTLHLKRSLLEAAIEEVDRHV